MKNLPQISFLFSIVGMLLIGYSCNIRLSCNDCQDIGKPVYVQLFDADGQDLLFGDSTIALDQITIVFSDEDDYFYSNSLNDEFQALEVYPGFSDQLTLEFSGFYEPVTLNFDIEKKQSEDCCGNRPVIKRVNVDGVEAPDKEIVQLILQSLD